MYVISCEEKFKIGVFTRKRTYTYELQEKVRI